MRHIEVILDGIALSSLGPFLVQQVHEDAPTMESTTAERPGRAGSLPISVLRKELRIAVELMIRERFDLAWRAAVLETLAAWAGGEHILQLSSRPDRRLRVVCTSVPSLLEVRNPAAILRIEFTAFTVPYWEDQETTRLSLDNGAAGSGELLVHGSAPSPVGLIVTPTGGTLSSFSATVGGHTVALAGLSIAQNVQLLFYQDSRDCLMIESAETSLLSARTAASADELLADPGRIAVSYTASTACGVTFISRGRWK